MCHPQRLHRSVRQYKCRTASPRFDLFFTMACYGMLALSVCLGTVSPADAELPGEAASTTDVRRENGRSETQLVGRVVDEFRLKDEFGGEHSLSDHADASAVVIAFLGTECPLVKLYGPRLSELQQELKGQGVVFLGINSNRQDSLAEIAAYARRHSLEFPILKDTANRVADQIGATRTPEIVVLDQDRVIRYHGRIDDQYGVGYVRDNPQRSFLKEALDDLLAKREVRTPETEIVGCFIGKVRPVQQDATVTWSGQIASIIRKHCVDCHRPGEIAPFSLTTCEETAGWGDTIVEVIREQRMPPWHANPDYGHFTNARVMSVEEKELIYQWVSAGCPEGDGATSINVEDSVVEWTLPREPDLIVNMRERPYEVPARGTVKYQYFKVDPGFEEDRWVSAVELQPGNRAVVHHILLFAAPPEGRSNSPTTGEFLAAYVPGYHLPVYPKGMAKHIPAGSQLVFQLHYTPIGTDQVDLSRAGLVFASDEDVEQVVITRQVSNHKDLVIPPHDGNFKVEASSQPSPVSVKLLGLMPHMHLRGKAFRYEIVSADGTREILLDVPHYDFNWQTGYRLAEPLPFPAGTQLHCVAHFDNSADNLNNPDPSATVRWGDQTWNEMMIGYFDVAVPRDALGIDRGTGKGNPPTDTTAGSADAITIGGQKTTVARLVQTLRKLDTNGDNQLQKAEVPDRYQPVFKALDHDDDDVVTRREVEAAIRKLRRSDQATETGSQ